MADLSLVIEIDRTGLGLPPLVLDASPGATFLGVTAYQEPAMQARVRYAPSSDIMHGDTPLGWTWQQAILPFDVAAFGATSEQEQRAAIAELVAAVTQFPRYDVTVTVGTAPSETWRCDPGTVAPAGNRSITDLRLHNAVWHVTIPCHPVRY